MTLGGKTLVETASIVDFLSQAKPWSPNLAKVAHAQKGRVDARAKPIDKLTTGKRMIDNSAIGKTTTKRK